MPQVRGRGQPIAQYLGSLVIVGVCTVVAVGFRTRLELTSLAMVYLFGVLVASVRLSKGASVLSAILSVTAFFYFCVPVHDSFVLEDYTYLITLSAMLAVSLVISGLVDRTRAQAMAVQESMIRIQSEEMRNSLLSAMSHNIKTPLAAIYGAATSLLEEGDLFDSAQKRGLIGGIAKEAERLDLMVTNILEMTRLESGVQAQTDWHPLEEIVGAALSRSDAALQGHPVSVRIPEDLPLIRVDDVLLEQVFANLIDNFAKYTPEGSRLEIEAKRRGDVIVVTVTDDGNGFPSGSEGRLFEKFYRGGSSGVRGAGLGLAICRAIMTVHHGTISAARRPEGGTIISLELPTGGVPPEVRGLLEGSSV